MVEIMFSFIKQGIDEEGNSKHDPMKEIATRYFCSTFIIDMIALIPWGYILSFIDYKFRVFWVLKIIRIG